MAEAEPHILVRQKAACLHTALRFASRPCVALSGSTKGLMDLWRDAHNRNLSPAALKREGKVVSLLLSEQLMAEYSSHRAMHADWQPLEPFAGLRELPVVAQDSKDFDGAAGAGSNAASDDEVDDDEDESLARYVRPLPGTDAGGYVRQPALHGRQLALVMEGDVWLARLGDADVTFDCGAAASDSAPAGSEGLAPLVCSRLTTQGTCSHPHFSPDGKLLAFSAGAADGSSDAPEVYALELGGRGLSPRRLTYLGGACEVVGWSADGSHIFFRSSAEQPMSHLVELWMVPHHGRGRPSPLRVGVSHQLVSLPDGSYLIGRHTVDPAHVQWKGYRGGATGHFWHGRRGGRFARVPLPDDWNLGDPAVYGNRLYFTSDHEGVTNIYSMPVPEPGASGAAHDAAAASAAHAADAAHAAEAEAAAAATAAAVGTVVAHTCHRIFGVREVSLDASGAGLLAYNVAGELHLLRLEPAAASIRPAVATEARCISRLGVSAALSETWDPECMGSLDGFALHPEGHSLLLTARGRLFALAGLWHGPGAQLGETDDGFVRYRCAGFTHTSRPICAACGASGDWSIVVFSSDPSQLATGGSPAGGGRGGGRGGGGGGKAAWRSLVLRGEASNLGEPLELAPNPEAPLLAVATHDLRLLLVDLNSGVTTRLDVASHDGGIFDLSWSADGKWLSYAAATSANCRTSAIKLCEVRTRKVFDITNGLARDSSPSFDPAGRYLAFLSTRSYRPVEDEVLWQLNFSRAQRPFLVLLADDVPDPTRPPPRPPGWTPEDDDDETDDEGGSPRGGDQGEGDDDDRRRRERMRAGGGRGARGARAEESGDDDEDDGVRPVRVDPKGLSSRIVSVPVAAGRLEQLAVLWDDQLVYTRLKSADADGGGGGGGGGAGGGGGEDGGGGGDEEAAGALMRCDLGTGKEVELIADVEEFQLSADRAACAVLCDEGGEPRLRVYEAGVRPPQETDDDEEIDVDEPGPESGLVNVDGRVLLEVDTRMEWQQLFYEGWASSMRKVHPSILSGIDGAHILAEYEPILARIACHGELLDLMREMQGELGASHAFVEPPKREDDDDVEGEQGSLGARCEWDEATDGWRIVEICRGDPWEARDTAPLSRGAVCAKAGDVLVAINQRRLTRELPPEVAMRRLAGKEVYLTIRTPGGEGASSPSLSAGGGGQKGGKAKGTNARGGGGKGGRGGGKDRDAAAAERTVRVRVSGTAQLRRARYLDWVASRRELVHSRVAGSSSRSAGAGATMLAVGYVHVADMEEAGYADFTRQFLAECRSDVDVLILDLRGNAGGTISDLILSRLTQRRLGCELAPHGLAASIPEHAAPPGLVVVVDEFTSSDGELLAYHLQTMLHAPVVGRRTWGGVIAMDETELVDGTTVTHPAFVLRLDAATMPLENRGVVPTFAVEATPHDAVNGRDRQLEVAIDQAAAMAAEASRQRRARSDAAANGAPEWTPLPRARKHWSAPAEA